MRLLSIAHDAEFYKSMRERFASSEQWAQERESMVIESKAAWFQAKRILCENKEEIAFELKQELAKFKEPTPGLQNVIAAIKVIEEEIAKEAEMNLTSESE